MADFSRFTRVIGVRVSQSEYEEMREFCYKNGLHSIAEFVRKAALTYMTPDKPKTDLDITEKERLQDVQRLEKQIKKLRKEMANLKLAQQNEAMDPAKGGVDK